METNPTEFFEYFYEHITYIVISSSLFIFRAKHFRLVPFKTAGKMDLDIFITEIERSYDILSILLSKKVNNRLSKDVYSI